MSEVRKARQEKMNRDKMLKLRAKEIRNSHKSVSHIDGSELYKIEQELTRDYFPVE